MNIAQKKKREEERKEGWKVRKVQRQKERRAEQREEKRKRGFFYDRLDREELYQNYLKKLRVV